MDIREALKNGIELVESAYAHVSHGGPTRADAESWLKLAKGTLEHSQPATQHRKLCGLCNNPMWLPEKDGLHESKMTGSKSQCADAPWAAHPSVAAQPPAMPTMSGILAQQPSVAAQGYHAPNVSHITDDLISRRQVYRQVERSAGMTVPQTDYDCMGEPFTKPNPDPSDVFAHVLKIIADVKPVAAQGTDGLREALKLAEPIVAHFASLNPKWFAIGGGQQDPMGAHAALVVIRAALAHPEKASQDECLY